MALAQGQVTGVYSCGEHYLSKESAVPRYLLQLAYTTDAWGAQVKNPQDRVEIVRPLLERLGGSFESVYFGFGEYDIVAIMDMPDNVSAAAMSMVVSAGGAAKAIKTTPLMTVEEGIQAMRKAGEAAATYRAPGA
jgi:uncharacterized protein with GYD domain